jgi:hypothetical protein
MIISIAIDTDDDKDGIDTLVKFVKAMGRDDVTAEKPRIVVNDIQSAARLSSAGEQVIYRREASTEEIPQKKKRGRKPKAKV